MKPTIQALWVVLREVATDCANRCGEAIAVTNEPALGKKTSITEATEAKKL